jgi:hypothetical protein
VTFGKEKMKIRILLFMLVCLVGCAKADRTLADERDLKIAAQEQVYAKVHGMTHEKVIDLLGRPMRTTEEGEYWELRFSPKCYASVAVKFDDKGIAYQTKKAVSFEKSRPAK